MHILSAITVAVSLLAPGIGEGDRSDTLSASVVTVSKINAVLGRATSPVVTLSGKELRHRNLSSPKTLSSLVPNLHIPEYGSAMTSSIYVRGIGSRLENPSIGLYVDEVPIMDKNMFDTEFLEVERADFVSGPQGTLFGRNAMVGVLSVTTAEPSAAAAGGLASVSYGSGGTIGASGLLRGGRAVLAARAFHTNGLYTNTYNGKKIDGGGGFSFRLRYRPVLQKEGRTAEYSVWLSYLNQGGWPYRQEVDGVLAPVAYNDVSDYRRLSVVGSFVEGMKIGRHDLKSITSVQYLKDRMNMDQDFTVASMFTLQQRQKQVAVTKEYVFRPSVNVGWWDSRSGFFTFHKICWLEAPVHFMSDGIESLILGAANAHIPPAAGRLAFQEDEFDINGDFRLRYHNIALYHESYFTFGLWKITAGIRLDYEYQHMKYDSGSLVHYALVPRMTEFAELRTSLEGSGGFSWIKAVPKFAIRFGGEDNYLFASVSEGFRAGGYNTQIFSDLLQNKMAADLRGSFGGGSGSTDESDAAAVTKYKPEESWNFEFGGHATLRSGGHVFSLSASAFDIECRNQQITVFPEGQGTGRMMANAGRSRSYGAEASASWLADGWKAVFSYGYAHASFRQFNDARNDYSGKRVPYVPSATWHASLGRRFDIPGGGAFKGFELTASASGCGKIFWDEANTAAQKAYTLFGADAAFDLGGFDIFAHCTNLTGRDYSVFCFKSVGNTFMQKGRPRCITGGIRIKF